MIDVKSNRVALSYDEILCIANHPLGNNQSLQRVRDIFLWTCYTGLRYSDAIKLCKDDIKEDMSGRLWIMSTQQKTGNAIRIPILAPAKVIYDRYETNRNITGLVLPSYSNQKINSYLKQIALMVGIKTNLTHPHWTALLCDITDEQWCGLQDSFRYDGILQHSHHRSVRKSDPNHVSQDC